MRTGSPSNAAQTLVRRLSGFGFVLFGLFNIALMFPPENHGFYLYLGVLQLATGALVLLIDDLELPDKRSPLLTLFAITAVALGGFAWLVGGANAVWAALTTTPGWLLISFLLRTYYVRTHRERS